MFISCKIHIAHVAFSKEQKLEFLRSKRYHMNFFQRNERLQIPHEKNFVKNRSLAKKKHPKKSNFVTLCLILQTGWQLYYIIIYIYYSINFKL